MLAIASALALCATLITPSVQAATILYGNNAGGGTDSVEKFDAVTGAKLSEYHPSAGNGRGVVVVGNTLYSTVVGDNRIYKTDLTTGLSLGSITTTNTSMSTLAWDGSSFWTSDYAGTNRGFQIDATTGANIKTVTFGLASRYMDGMEYFNNKLIVNREDAGFVYDIYDTDGNVLTASFITTSYRSTGIAFDGTNFFVSDIFNNKIHEYSGITGLEIGTGLTLQGSPVGNGQNSHLIEDLSVDYAQREDTGGRVPDGSFTVGLLGLTMLGGSVLRRLLAKA